MLYLLEDEDEPSSQVPIIFIVIAIKFSTKTMNVRCCITRWKMMEMGQVDKYTSSDAMMVVMMGVVCLFVCLFLSNQLMSNHHQPSNPREHHGVIPISPRKGPSYWVVGVESCLSVVHHFLLRVVDARPMILSLQTSVHLVVRLHQFSYGTMLVGSNFWLLSLLFFLPNQRWLCQETSSKHSNRCWHNESHCWYQLQLETS